MPCQCNEILTNSRQQCQRAGYATIGPHAFCRLHFSFRIAQKEQFLMNHEACDEKDDKSLKLLLRFFGVVHSEERQYDGEKEE